MPWEDELFAFLDDLEQQAGALWDADRAPELVDRERAEYQQVPLAARLMASLDRDLTLHVTGVGAVAGRLERVARGWCLLAGLGQDWVVRLAAVAAVDGAADRAVPEVAWSPVTRLGLGSALRRLADAGERCVVHRTDGARHDGVLRRVGQDFVEVLEGDPPRVTLVAFEAVAAIQSRES
ncbi:hypothetical protein [Nocardioides sp.]|uniref:hypothetical protein n=1 Tax=Nocardioides sp. TaxID=35761 RepID=UPI00271CB855|nr:hypothetical protein [Nocardioides sp.]MDO9456131.1 hypothetical protein [Nocardioides sp.]